MLLSTLVSFNSSKVQLEQQEKALDIQIEYFQFQ